MRRLTRYKLASLLLCGLAAAPSPLAAQQKGRVKLQTEDAPRPAASGQEARPEAAPLRVEAVSPQLEAVLKEWFDKTQGIRKLQGEHRRWTYDTTFAVAKVSSGKFFYEGPDKGRIDITPDDPTSHKDVDPKTEGVQVEDASHNVYSLKPDVPERWICDGQRMVKVDDAEKTYNVMPIPPEAQGANIMDGPLPFLFGMPPEKAKQRYAMELLAHPDPAIVYVVVKPRLQKDASNWQRADVMLSKETFLPVAVQLLDPAGTGKTVFSFGKPEVNPRSIFEIFTGDPFSPRLAGYKEVQSGTPAPIQPLNLKGKPLQGVPSVVGLDHKTAKNVLAKRGYRENIEIVRGPVTDNVQLVYHVAEQSPPPNAMAKPGDKIRLTLYVTEKDLKKDAAKP